MKTDHTLFNHIIDDLDLKKYGSVYSGKVRDSITLKDKRILIATDRLSAFDKILTTIPLKGAVLTALATFWLKETEHITKNHLIDVPHPNVSVCLDCSVIPVEVVVRGYLTGSAWRAYQGGESVSGILFAPGMKEFQKLDKPILTPSTKAAIGNHDEPISESEIISSGIVTEKIWSEVREKALALFQFASEKVSERNLILVDTKFEFGIRNGEVILVDEIFTLDSSRFWIKGYRGDETPTMLDKEPIRQWLLSKGFNGEGEIPQISDEYRLSLTTHYIESLRKISGISLEKNSISSREEIYTVVEKITQQLK